MIFLTFHTKLGDEIKLKLEAIIGFRSYVDGSHAVLMVGETQNPIFVTEDWGYFVSKMKELADATERAAAMTTVMRKFNGKG